MAENYFDKVYQTTDPDKLRSVYDDWAKTYNADLGATHYATPGRIAQALARHAPKDAKILDFACGTGLSGKALAAEGFHHIDGYDVSPGMLEQARKTGAYGRLIEGAPGRPLPFNPDDYDAVTACGAISPGAAPAHLIDDILALITPGTLFAISLNQHGLDDPDFLGRIERAIANETVTRLEAETGPHLPEIGIESTVFILRRA